MTPVDISKYFEIVATQLRHSCHLATVAPCHGHLDGDLQIGVGASTSKTLLRGRVIEFLSKILFGANWLSDEKKKASFTN